MGTKVPGSHLQSTTVPQCIHTHVCTSIHHMCSCPRLIPISWQRSYVLIHNSFVNLIRGVVSSLTHTRALSLSTDKHQRTLLFLASAGTQHNAVDAAIFLKWLLQCTRRINARDSEGETALHFAADNQNAEAVKLLLDCHADPNITSNSGRVPLHYAALHAQNDVLDVLLKPEYKTDPAKVNKLEQTALHLVVLSKPFTVLHQSKLKGEYDVFYAMIERLLESGCPVGSPDHNGNTPLMAMKQAHVHCWTGAGQKLADLLTTWTAKMGHIVPTDDALRTRGRPSHSEEALGDGTQDQSLLSFPPGTIRETDGSRSAGVSTVSASAGATLSAADNSGILVSNADDGTNASARKRHQRRSATERNANNQFFATSEYRRVGRTATKRLELAFIPSDSDFGEQQNYVYKKSGKFGAGYYPIVNGVVSDCVLPRDRRLTISDRVRQFKCRSYNTVLVCSLWRMVDYLSVHTLLDGRVPFNEIVFFLFTWSL